MDLLNYAKENEFAIPRRQRGQQFLRERLHGGRQEGRWPGDLADDPRDPQRTLWGLPCWQ